MKTVFVFLLLLKLTCIQSQTIEAIKAHQLIKMVEQPGDTMYVVNFWATWCAPCVKELPIFNTEQLSQSHSPIKILLVSLDFKSQLTGLQNFVKDRQIEEKVLWMNEKNPNTWIDLIDKSWTGAIPATKIYYHKRSRFHEGELNSKQLKQMIELIQ